MPPNLNVIMRNDLRGLDKVNFVEIVEVVHEPSNVDSDYEFYLGDPHLYNDDSVFEKGVALLAYPTKDED